MRHGEQLYDDEALLDILRDTASTLGHTPSLLALKRAMGYSLTQTLYNRFGSYANACERAGLTPNARQPGGGERQYSESDILEAFVRMSKLLGHTPSIREWDRHRESSEPASVTVRNRVGGWPTLEGWAASQLQLGSRDPSSPREKNGVVA